MKRMVSAVIAIALTISWVGCSKSQKAVEVVDTSSSNEGSEFSFKDGILGVNDRAYGSVRAGDKVIRGNERLGMGAMARRGADSLWQRRGLHRRV
ncbi:MAG: hypothetical protein ACLQVF_28195, partial [Isosphaeraceae bacterium]